MVINDTDDIISENVETKENTSNENFNIVNIYDEENIETEDTQSITSNDSSKENETIETNCLALTIRKDYHLSIIKNTVFTTIRVTCKVFLYTLFLNLLKMFF